MVCQACKKEQENAKPRVLDNRRLVACDTCWKQLSYRNAVCKNHEKERKTRNKIQ